MNEAVLAIEGLKRTYQTGDGLLTVLSDIDLHVAKGEVVGLVGPSGSGKSSLLHAAGLLERPTAGRILINGREGSLLPDVERTRLRLTTIGFIYQFHHLLPELSAEENVALPALIAGVKPREAQARAADLLASLHLGGRLRHQPAQLSGGEQQRVAVARALVNAPRLLIADEPTGNLDPDNSRSIFHLIQTISHATGVAALIATHNLELARDMDRVCTLKGGRLVRTRDDAPASAVDEITLDG
jgi:lipoprotein-releasing system ATP-binding protein